MDIISQWAVIIILPAYHTHDTHKDKPKYAKKHRTHEYTSSQCCTANIIILSTTIKSIYEKLHNLTRVNAP